ncbi:capsule biosynthesis protein [Pedobacter antarcticus 4BY]|uniref:Capsule biosynthesis protein n=2 Tax=Pedobacter antarcticus TaxID=34086 RepID=A0A081PE24_9SPHI|nr:SLBB domain-containing protein [Pedobacter antarcticus]KEQ28947.1 capsule biosynthesis protein [Pedobacter antarcticus 4BY]SFF12457.1 protein involved in polysaccharide export, contains SLBB domain of the beta-grasp fold [Pedobacter antarcticus]
MNFQKIIASLILVIAIAFSTGAYAQTNYSDVRVDDLTDAQIQQLIQKAESVGYTDVQLEQMAAAQGMKPEEVQKLRLRVEKLKIQTGSDKDPKNKNQTKNEFSEVDDTFERSYGDDEPRDSTKTKYDLEQKKKKELKDAFGNLIPKIFGAELFANSNIKFEPNLRMATPKSYIIGPDDQLLIDLTGDNEANYKLTVSPDGNVRLQYVGLISVGGLSIEQATSKLRSLMSGTYPGLKSGRTQVAINLGNIRSIKVTILGEVVKPGSYTLSSLSTVFNALNASGGPNENGSFRKIQVVRNNNVIATIDVYDFLLNGIQKGNVRLQDQDIINIPVYQSRVEMSGEVKRPALFEVLNTESLEDVIRFAGGFSNKAYTARIKVLQNTNKERRITDVFADDYSKYNPLNGDKYVVEQILDRFANRVEITGAVFRPGQYELENGLTLKQLILKADGLKEDAFLNRGYISRLNSDNTLALQSFDVSKILSGAEQDIVLKREDKVTISSLFDLRDEYKVDIKGEVRNPGKFDFAEGMTLESLIQMAGGFKEGATPNRVEIARRIKNSDATSANAITAEVINVSISPELQIMESAPVLQPFDIVSIRSSEGYQVQQQVKIEGEVLYPGIYTITRKDERISDLIKRAGGLTALSFAEGASLKRPGPDKPEEDEEVKLDKYGNPILKKESKTLIAASKKKEEEEMQKLANLKRLQQGEGAVVDTAQLAKEVKTLGSDLVGIDLVRILKKPLSKYDLLLEDGDVIKVPKQLQTVKVTGEVLRPINIVYSSNKSMVSYINGAGGFTYNANKKGAYIQYANGAVDANHKFLFFNNYPKVKPGAEIFVPKRAPREKLGVAGVVGITSALATVAAVLISVLR